MKPVGQMTQAEVGAYVQTHLRTKGIEVVLSGGAVVAIYTSGKYVSRDLDMVNLYSAKHSVICEVMIGLGFREAGRHFEHPDSEFFVEFPPGPLSFGDEVITNIAEFPTEIGLLRLITPTDSVKDRLAWYFHYDDRQCLSQAVLVSKHHRIDIDELRRWSTGEGKLEAFEEICPQLEGR